MVEGNGSTDGIIPEGEGDSEGDMKVKFIEEKSVSRRILKVTNNARIHKMITAIIARNAALRFRLSFPSLICMSQQKQKKYNICSGR